MFDGDVFFAVLDFIRASFGSVLGFIRASFGSVLGSKIGNSEFWAV